MLNLQFGALTSSIWFGIRIKKEETELERRYENVKSDSQLSTSPENTSDEAKT